MFSLIACCQELNVSFSGNDPNLVAYSVLAGIWSFGGTVHGMDYYTFLDGTVALWHYPVATPYWIFGPIDILGTLDGYYLGTASTSTKFVRKCPNNHGQIKWSWFYLNQATGQQEWTNDVHVKCASEGDFCTSTNPCGSEQGDCDSHDECQTGLTCGLNNCGLDEDPEMDCCYAATIGDDTFCTTVNNNDPSCLLNYFSIIFNLLLTFLNF